MKNFLILTGCSALFIAVSYLLFAFVAWSFDPVKWHWTLRLFFVFPILLCIGVLGEEISNVLQRRKK